MGITIGANMNKRIKATIACLISIFILTGCTSFTEAELTGKTVGYDTSKIKKVPDIAELLPKEIKDKKVLRIGTSAGYAPSVFFADDGKTIIGYDNDVAQAIANVLGIKKTLSHTPFDNLLPSVGSKFDVAIGGFTITKDRIKKENMISYVKAGSMFAVAKGNPKKISTKNLCGTTMGVQIGTYQMQDVPRLSKECVKKGKKPIELAPYDLQSKIVPTLIGLKVDVMYADSPVVGYAIQKTDHRIQQLGDIFDETLNGIVVDKKNNQLALAIQKATQYLIDNGTLEKIMDKWGVKDVVLKKSEINPKVKN